MDLEMDIRCYCCRKTHKVIVPAEGYAKWMAGMVIQKAMPEVPVAVRELLISNTCGPCYDEIFGENN